MVLEEVRKLRTSIRRLASSFAALIMISLPFVVLLTPNADAGGIGTIGDKSTSVFYDSTGTTNGPVGAYWAGWPPSEVYDREVSLDPLHNWVGAYAYCVEAGWPSGVDTYASVFKTVSCVANAPYAAQMVGHICGVANANLVAGGNLYFYFKVRDASLGGTEVVKTLIAEAHAIQNTVTLNRDFSTTLSFVGIPGHQYYLEAYVRAMTNGVLGVASADADPYHGGLTDLIQGIRYSSITVWKSSFSCLLEGTGITMGSGASSPIEEIKKGDHVASWDFATQKVVSTEVMAVKKSSVDVMLSINDGLLTITPTGQAVYVRAGDFEGWVSDAANIQPGWELLSPITGAWIVVDHTDILTGHYKVFDLTVLDPNNYFANGVLVHNKPRPV